jgi:hypothetical protein
MAGLTPSQVQNCTFSLLCTKTWDQLRAIEDEKRVRFCGECKKLVHLCTTAAEVKFHSEARHCVAIKLRNEPRMLLGDIKPF